jgi:hypothetical protein
LNFAIGQTIIPENFPENSTFGKRVNGGARRGDREAEAVALLGDDLLARVTAAGLTHNTSTLAIRF